jgi:hypothetical protein
LSVESAVRTVVIVLLDPTCNAQLGLIEALVLVEPHFKAAMEALDVAVALGMVVGVRRCVMARRFRLST